MPEFQNALRVLENLGQLMPRLVMTPRADQPLSSLQTSVQGMRVVTAEKSTAVGGQLREHRSRLVDPARPGDEVRLGTANGENMRVFRPQGSPGIGHEFSHLPFRNREFSVQTGKPDEATPTGEDLRVIDALQPRPVLQESGELLDGRLRVPGLPGEVCLLVPGGKGVGVPGSQGRGCLDDQICEGGRGCPRITALPGEERPLMD